MYTLVRIYLRRKRRNASDDLGVREVELIPAVGDEMVVACQGAAIRAAVVSVVLHGLPDLDGLLIPLLYLVEM